MRGASNDTQVGRRTYAHMNRVDLELLTSTVTLIIACETQSDYTVLYTHQIRRYERMKDLLHLVPCDGDKGRSKTQSKLQPSDTILTIRRISN